jgi:hypothetical protein
MSITIRVTPARARQMTVDQLATLEAVGFGEQPRVADLRDMLTHFVVDDSGSYVAFAQGQAAIGRLTLDEMVTVASDMNKQMQEMAVPPLIGGD